MGSAIYVSPALGTDGTQKWRANVGTVYNSTAVIDREGTVYLGVGPGSMYSFDSAGNQRWSFATNGGIDMTPLIGKHSGRKR